MMTARAMNTISARTAWAVMSAPQLGPTKDAVTSLAGMS